MVLLVLPCGPITTMSCTSGDVTVILSVGANLYDAGGPRMAVGKEVIDLTALFGNRLNQRGKGYFEAGFNLTRG